MPKTKYIIKLSEEEKKMLHEITHKETKSSVKTILHANILLKSNENNTEVPRSIEEIAGIFEVSPTTVKKIRQKYAEEGIEAALERKTRISPPIISKITGEFEAQVIATALSPVPLGRAKWTLRLLAEHCMEKQYIVSISHTAIGELLNSNEVKPHLSKYYCIPKENDAHFVAAMEDVISVYHRRYNQRVPVVCMDEKPVQLLGDICDRVNAKPLRVDADTGLIKPGELEKIDYQYERCGVASIFVFCEPLAGWRHMEAFPTRTKGDFAMITKRIIDTFYPKADKIVLVADNLNTHNASSFYEAFPPEIAFELAQKIEFHHTPKHGSWLNIAESELSSMAIQALGSQRIKSLESLNEILFAWQSDRNRHQKGVKWQFTNEQARIKLNRLYPTPIFT